MKTRLMYWPVLAILFIIASCNNPSSSDDPEIVSMPLTVGNSWDYLSYGIDDEGDSINVETVVLTVVSDTLVNGITWFKLETDIPGVARTTLARYFSNQDDGIHKTKDLSQPLDSKLFIPNPGEEIPLYSYSSDENAHTVNYFGEITDNGNTFHNYVFEYTKAYGHELASEEFNVQVSAELGIQLFETAFYSRDRTTDDENAPYVLLRRQYLELKSATLQ